MGWAYCGQDYFGREIGYAITATCDKRGCDAVINRGLGCACGGMHNGDKGGCGMYFCDAHGGGLSAGPRGGCGHRQKKPYGETFCQLLKNDLLRYSEDKYWCACGKWKLWVPADSQSLERWRDVPGYVDHLSTSLLVTDMMESGEEPIRA